MQPGHLSAHRPHNNKPPEPMVLVRPRPFQLMSRLAPAMLLSSPASVVVPERTSSRTTSPGYAPSAIMSPGQFRSRSRPCTQIRLDEPAHAAMHDQADNALEAAMG
jgi:hypothetical protein